MHIILCAVLILSGLQAFAEHAPFQTAKVVSQNIGAENGGAAIVPMGTMMVGVPITRRSDVIVIQTEHSLITLSEWMTGRGAVIVPVNDTIQFYQDGKWIIIMDAARHKHKFSIVHIEALNP